MISLKEAFRLCRIDDREVVHLCDNPEGSAIWSWPITGKEIREKYDLRNTIVTEIRPYFCMGEFEGVLFIIKKRKRRDKRNEDGV